MCGRLDWEGKSLGLNGKMWQKIIGSTFSYGFQDP